MPGKRGSGHAAHRAHQLGLAGGFVADTGLRRELVDAGAGAVERDFQHQLVARLHRPLEARAVDAHEVDDRIGIEAGAHGGKGQQRRGLGQRLEHQHARHHRPVREVADEERLVDGDVLQRLDGLAVHLQHAVDEQERIAVRQLLQDLMDVHHGRRCHGFFSRALMRSRRLCSCLSAAAFFSQDALSSMGNTPVYMPGLWMVREMKVPVETKVPSAMLMWPWMRAAPPIMQLAPMTALPAMPVQAATAVLRPMRTLCATWTRLSSFTPSSITVSASAPRSMQVLAPISTSSPMRTAPSCSIFS